MPKSKRRGQRTPKRSSGRKNRNQSSTGLGNANQFTSTSGMVRLRSIIGRLPSGTSMFPDILYSQGRTIYEADITTGASTQQVFTFNSNSNFFDFGPSLNGGTAVSNVPSGADRLLSTTEGPYVQSWGLETQWTLEIINTNSNLNSSMRVTILPTINNYSFISTLTIAQLAEQRGASQTLLPSSLSGALTYRGTYHPADIFGISKHIYENSDDYGAFVGAFPPRVSYFHVLFTPINGALVECSIRLIFNTRFKFAGLQTMGTAQPS